MSLPAYRWKDHPYSQGVKELLKELEKMEHKFQPFQNVLVRQCTREKWRCNFFSNYDDDFSKKALCIDGIFWNYCIPYEGNEHLLGTTNSPEQKHKYKWGDKVEVRPKDIWIKALYNEPSKDNPHKHRVYGYHEFYGHLSAFVIHEDNIRPLADDNS